PLEKIAAHKTSPIPELGARRDDVPRWLEGVYRSMMCKQPSGRPRTAADVLQALSRGAARREAADETSAAGEDSALSLFFTDEQMAAARVNQLEPWREEGRENGTRSGRAWRGQQAVDEQQTEPAYVWPEIDISFGSLLLFLVCGVVGVAAISLLLAIVFS